MVQAHLNTRKKSGQINRPNENESHETTEKEIVISDLDDMEPDESCESEGLPQIDESAVDESAEQSQSRE